MRLDGYSRQRTRGRLHALVQGNAAKMRESKVLVLHKHATFLLSDCPSMMRRAAKEQRSRGPRCGWEGWFA